MMRYLKEGSSGNIGSIIIERKEALGRKVMLIKDVTSTSLGKEEIMVCL
jgi:hypothetical protein